MQSKLPGGNMNSVVRDGDTVRRTTGAWTPTIHRYLDHLAAAGIDWIPRAIGIEGESEILSFVEGDVPLYPLPEWVWTDDALADAGGHLRAIHDASIGFDARDAIWQWPSSEPYEVICHNDFAPHNLVFQNGRLIGAIDFDLCAPGPRISDIANLATRMVPLTSELHAGAVRDDQWQRRIQLVLDAYGSEIHWDDVVRAAVPRLREEADFTRALARQSGKAGLLDDAALYERDAVYLELFLNPA
jgi:aminoglycoside phosphotransferase (APT) family kinase protein